MLKNSLYKDNQLYYTDKINLNTTTNILDTTQSKIKTDKFSRYIEKSLCSLSKTQ